MGKICENLLFHDQTNSSGGRYKSMTISLYIDDTDGVTCSGTISSLYHYEYPALFSLHDTTGGFVPIGSNASGTDLSKVSITISGTLVKGRTYDAVYMKCGAPACDMGANGGDATYGVPVGEISISYNTPSEHTHYYTPEDIGENFKVNFSQEYLNNGITRITPSFTHWYSDSDQVYGIYWSYNGNNGPWWDFGQGNCVDKNAGENLQIYVKVRYTQSCKGCPNQLVQSKDKVFGPYNEHVHHTPWLKSGKTPAQLKYTYNGNSAVSSFCDKIVFDHVIGNGTNYDSIGSCSQFTAWEWKDSGGIWRPFNHITTGPFANKNLAVVDGLSPNTKYDIQVRYTNEAGTTEMSMSVKTRPEPSDSDFKINDTSVDVGFESVNKFSWSITRNDLSIKRFSVGYRIFQKTEDGGWVFIPTQTQRRAGITNIISEDDGFVEPSMKKDSSNATSVTFDVSDIFLQLYWHELIPDTEYKVEATLIGEVYGADGINDSYTVTKHIGTNRVYKYFNTLPVSKLVKSASNHTSISVVAGKPGGLKTAKYRYGDTGLICGSYPLFKTSKYIEVTLSLIDKTLNNGVVEYVDLGVAFINPIGTVYSTESGEDLTISFNYADIKGKQTDRNIFYALKKSRQYYKVRITNKSKRKIDCDDWSPDNTNCEEYGYKLANGYTDSSGNYHEPNPKYYIEYYGYIDLDGDSPHVGDTYHDRSIVWVGTEDGPKRAIVWIGTEDGPKRIH